MNFRKVTIPSGQGSQDWTPDERARFVADISQYIDAGQNVQFVGPNGENAEIAQIHLSTDGTVKTSPIGGTPLSYAFIAGGWHTHRANKIYHNGTTAGIALKGRLFQRTY